jgi:hypothetical protein
MKPLFFLIGIIACCINLSTQTQKKSLVSELYLSVNRTFAFYNPDFNCRFGCGIGADHIFRLGKVVDYQMGVEFNCTSIFGSRYIPLHNWSRIVVFNKDIINNFYCFSIPAGFRYNIGKKVKVFYEHGLFYDLTFFSTESGTKVTIDTETNKERRESFNMETNRPSSPGLYSGLGIKIPGNKFDYLIKTDFKIRIVHNGNEDHAFYNKLDIGIIIK